VAGWEVCIYGLDSSVKCYTAVKGGLLSFWCWWVYENLELKAPLRLLSPGIWPGAAASRVTKTPSIAFKTSPTAFGMLSVGLKTLPKNIKISSVGLRMETCPKLIDCRNNIRSARASQS